MQKVLIGISSKEGPISNKRDPLYALDVIEGVNLWRKALTVKFLFAVCVCVCCELVCVLCVSVSAVS